MKSSLTSTSSSSFISASRSSTIPSHSSSSSFSSPVIPHVRQNSMDQDDPMQISDDTNHRHLTESPQRILKKLTIDLVRTYNEINEAYYASRARQDPRNFDESKQQSRKNISSSSSSSIPTVLSASSSSSHYRSDAFVSSPAFEYPDLSSSSIAASSTATLSTSHNTTSTRPSNTNASSSSSSSLQSRTDKDFNYIVVVNDVLNDRYVIHQNLGNGSHRPHLPQAPPIHP
jgi:hypothetical protein